MPTMLWMFSILIDQWYSKGRIFEFCNYSKEKQILFADSFFPNTNLIGGGKKPEKFRKQQSGTTSIYQVQHSL